jgi:hypothetical protein
MSKSARERTVKDSVLSKTLAHFESASWVFMSYGTQLRTENSQPITPVSINKCLSGTYIRRRSCER